MKTLILLVSAVLMCVPAHAFLGIEYGPALSKLYNPYYMNLMKGLGAEKALGGAHMYGPMIGKGRFLGYGKAYPYYYPMLAKEKEMGFEMGKGLGLYEPLIVEEKALEAGLGKGLGKVL